MSNAQKVIDERLRELIALPDNAIPANEARSAFRELQSLRAAPTPDAHSEVGDEVSIYMPSSDYTVVTTTKAAIEDLQSLYEQGWPVETEAHLLLAIAALQASRPLTAGVVKAEPVAITDAIEVTVIEVTKILREEYEIKTGQTIDDFGALSLAVETALVWAGVRVAE